MLYRKILTAFCNNLKEFVITLRRKVRFFFQVRPVVCIVSTTLQRFNVLAHDLHQRAEVSQQKARTSDLRTRIDTEILRIRRNIPPMLLLSSLSGVMDSNRISS